MDSSHEKNKFVVRMRFSLLGVVFFYWSRLPALSPSFCWFPCPLQFSLIYFLTLCLHVNFIASFCLWWRSSCIVSSYYLISLSFRIWPVLTALDISVNLAKCFVLDVSALVSDICIIIGETKLVFKFNFSLRS